MPIYTYKAKDEKKACPYCKNSFEEMQLISEEPLAECPECGVPVTRIIHPVKSKRDDSAKTILSDENLKKHGFKKLVNAGGGKFDVSVD